MQITFAELSTLLGQFWWPFFRLGAAMMFMPFFGDGLVPMWLRALLTLSLVVITAPLMPAMPAVELFSLSALFLAFEQALWGLFFGLILHLFFAVFTLLGQILSLQMGLAMAIMNDPVNGNSEAVLARIFMVFCTLLFLAIDGHLVVIDILIQSFTIWPVGSGLSDWSLHKVVALFSWLFTAALGLALPAIIAMLLANISFGVMNRAAPSLNIYALGFPMTMLLGLFATLLTITGVPERYTALVHELLSHFNQYMVGHP
ncbi:flagellar biosynthetic protein FliR [Vibrio sp. SM6]|uniref:Flagellar biosynthetic protein FliR n=1 Tax=Vibrio agarilyticus TaxID=2726741 RepID=A0A7X8TS03_9VIBR|nr:flagellar biosynthetic protein FliR [Vibrio agarilyticus]NLS13709.1 flagellar biosynthetic protein FliR [Vibrio agarilyticus]